MSHCYDVMQKAWSKLSENFPSEVRHGEIAIRFEILMNEMHEANHRLNDAINKDRRVTRSAMRLDKALTGETDNANQDSE